MKALITILTTCIISANAMEQLHEFTASDGRTLKAKVISYDGLTGKTEVEREDGKTVRVGIEAFSKDDQAYIKRWEPCSLFRSPTQFSIIPRRTLDQKSSYVMGMVDQETRYTYDLCLVNRTGLQMNHVSVEYLACYEPRKEDAQEEVQMVKGRTPVCDMEPGDVKVISMSHFAVSDKIQINKPEDVPGSIAGCESSITIRVAMEAPDGSQVERIISLPRSDPGTKETFSALMKKREGNHS
ncbi:hypothetical protein P4B35_15130 [Pontiellaceae bacterium B12227]|nr:hypothetical protein [Pontiellaceae bacterium B12227]